MAVWALVTLGAGGILVACESSPWRSKAREVSGPFSVPVKPAPPGFPTMMFWKSLKLPLERALIKLFQEFWFTMPRSSCSKHLLQFPLWSENKALSPLSGATPRSILSLAAAVLRTSKDRFVRFAGEKLATDAAASDSFPPTRGSSGMIAATAAADAAPFKKRRRSMPEAFSFEGLVPFISFFELINRIVSPLDKAMSVVVAVESLKAGLASRTISTQIAGKTRSLHEDAECQVH